MASSTTTIGRDTAASAISDSTSSGTAANTTKMMLACGMAAGPLFVVVVLIQVLTRPGFDLTRQAASLLTLGSLGWIQSANFIFTGLLTIVGAIGMRRALRGGRGGRWVPILMGTLGVGLTVGGVFHPDPSSGFPPGTPASASAVTSLHGVLHMVSGSVAFLALVALCFVLAHRFTLDGHRRWVICSRGAGILGAVGIASGGAPGGTMTLFIGVSIALLWVSAADRLVLAALNGVQVASPALPAYVRRTA
jgi:hypothetical membrane protein